MQVEALPVQQSTYAETILNEGQSLRVPGLRATGNCAPGQRISPIDQCKRGKNCAFLAEYEMSTGNAAPLHCIVHAGQVVKQERGGVEVLKGNCEFLSVNGIQPVRRCHLENQLGAHQTPGVVEHMAKGIFEAGTESRRPRKRGAEGFGKKTRVQLIHNVCRMHSDPQWR